MPKKPEAFVLASVYQRPVERTRGPKIVATKRVQLLGEDRTSALFPREGRDWVRVQLELGHEVLLTPEL